MHRQLQRQPRLWCVGSEMKKKIASILALLLLTGCEPRVVNLDLRVADPPYPPYYVQSNGCTFGGQSFNVSATCSLNGSTNTPTSQGDSVRVIVSAAQAGGISVTDDGNDTFRLIKPSLYQSGIAYPPQPQHQFYVLQATNVPAGVQNFTINASNTSSATIYDVVIVDFSAGVPAQSTYNTCTVPYGNSDPNACLPITSGSTPVSFGSVLLGIEIGVGNLSSPFTSCAGQSCGSDVNTQTTMSMIYQRNGDPLCSSSCPFFVTVSTIPGGGAGGAAYVQFPYQGGQLPGGGGWAAAIEALR
jgi:hypothetical protein